MIDSSSDAIRSRTVREIGRIGRFAVVGITATLVHAAIYLLLITKADTTPAAANVAGFLTAFAFSLLGQYGWTFADNTRAFDRTAQRTAVVRFALVAAIGFVLNAGFVTLVEALPDADPRLAVIFIVSVTPIATFLLSRHWVFAQRTVGVEAEPNRRGSAATPADQERIGGSGWRLTLATVLAAIPLLANSVWFGLPQSLDPDEGIFMGKALRMLAEGNLDPAWYGAPAQLLMYVLGAVYAGYIFALDQFGIIGSLSDAGRFYFDDPSGFLVLGRLVSVVSAAGCLVMMAAILRKARVRTPAILVAILVFSLSPLVLGYSSIIRMDFQQILFNLLTAYFCLLATRTAGWRNILLGGAFVGAAITSKYTGIAGAAPVVATVVWMVASRRVRPLSGAGMLFAAGVASVVAAFLTGPYLFLSFNDMLADLANEARPSHLGATSHGFLSSLSYYLTTATPDALGWGPCLLAAAGAVLSLRHPLALVTLPFVVVYLLFVSSLSLVWYRWFIPVVPFAAMFVAIAVDHIMHWAGDRRPGILSASLMVVGLLLLPTIVAGLDVARIRFLDRDTRVEALDWVEKSLPKGSRLLLETDAPGISSRDYQAFIVKDGALIPWAELEQRTRVSGYYTYFGQWNRPAGALVEAIRHEEIDYVLMSDWIDRFTDEAASYPRELSIYAELRGAFPLVREFARPAGWSGPRIYVLSAK